MSTQNTDNSNGNIQSPTSNFGKRIGLFNEKIINNIRHLSQLTDNNLNDMVVGCTMSPKTSLIKDDNMNNNNDLEFIKKLTAHYINLSKSEKHISGGFNGKRKITNRFSSGDENDLSEYGEYDYFVAKNKMKLMDDYEMQSRQRRDPKVTEKYNEILKKIMELLDVDEPTARTYRSALKITIGRKNPELAKYENDALRVAELEKIIQNKKLLKEELAKIDMDEIKQFMEKQAEKNKARQEEFRKKRSEMRQKISDSMSTDKHPPKHKKIMESEEDNRKKATLDTETENTEDKSKKSKKKETKEKKSKKKVNEDGYLLSSDIVFSPGI